MELGNRVCFSDKHWSWLMSADRAKGERTFWTGTIVALGDGVASVFWLEGRPHPVARKGDPKNPTCHLVENLVAI